MIKNKPKIAISKIPTASRHNTYGNAFEPFLLAKPWKYQGMEECTDGTSEVLGDERTD